MAAAQSAHLSWTAPSSTGGAPITGYTVMQSTGGASYTTSIFTASGTSADVTGLANATTYTFEVFATNAAGAGPPSSPSNAVTTP